MPEKWLPLLKRRGDGGKRKLGECGFALSIEGNLSSVDDLVPALNLLVDLRKRHNIGIIFVTHDMGQAYYVSDRILVMYHGELVEQGPVEKVLANPQHDYTKRLLADVPRLHGWGAILTKPDASR